MLREYWDKLLATVGGENSGPLAGQYFEEITMLYGESHRYYHNLSHVENLLVELEKISMREEVEYPAYVFWAIWYHDIIYNPGSPDNELESAELARLRMEALGVDVETIEACYQLIIATKLHQFSEIPFGNLFLDLDMGILAAKRVVYQGYVERIRKEFSEIPIEIFNAGRKNFLQEQLDLPRIFHSQEFEALENKARDNIAWEIQSISPK